MPPAAKAPPPAMPPRAAPAPAPAPAAKAPPPPAAKAPPPKAKGKAPPPPPPPPVASPAKAGPAISGGDKTAALAVGAAPFAAPPRVVNGVASTPLHQAALRTAL